MRRGWTRKRPILASPPPSSGIPPAGRADARSTPASTSIASCEFSVKDASWTVDFYVWFRWRGDDVQPGDEFQVVDGSIESKEQEEACMPAAASTTSATASSPRSPSSSTFRASRATTTCCSINIECPALPPRSNCCSSPTRTTPASARASASRPMKSSRRRSSRSPTPTRRPAAIRGPTPGVKSTYSQLPAGDRASAGSRWGFYFKTVSVAVRGGGDRHAGDVRQADQRRSAVRPGRRRPVCGGGQLLCHVRPDSRYGRR